jgi:protein-disulfide isomerase
VKSVGLKALFPLVIALALIAPGLRAAPTTQTRLTPDELTALKSLGSREAPVTIEVFADYECPQCRNFYETATRQLIDNYVSTGKVYLIHRDFPLSMHTYSHQAARWANAAALAGQFETVEQTLYAKQDDWGATGKIEQTLAAAIPAADMKKIREVEAADGAEIDAAIQHDISLGNSRGVNGTPTIFVTHHGQTTRLPLGGVSYTLLKQYLDYLLQH